MGALKLILSLCLLVLVNDVYSGYVVTTPKQWNIGYPHKVCAVKTAEEPVTTDPVLIEIVVHYHSISYPPLPPDHDPTLPPQRPVRINGTVENLIEATDLSQCVEISIPEGTTLDHADVTVTDSSGVKEKRLDIREVDHYSIFITTDKFMYKPGQKIQFRIMTIQGPYGQVSNSNYELVTVTSPSGTRLAQWNEVDNSKGLVNLDYQLLSEPEEGYYQIRVILDDGRTSSKSVKVEEYVLPRFEVTVKAPKYILPESEFFTYTVCAHYSYGLGLKGNLTFRVHNSQYGRKYRNVEKNMTISGCEDVKITSAEIDLLDDSVDAPHPYSLEHEAIIFEEGTDVEFRESGNKEITRTALKITEIVPTLMKPILPHAVKLKVSFPDGKPAANEPMEACKVGANAGCTPYMTNEKGEVLVYVPPEISDNVQFTFVISSVNYRRIEGSNQWNPIMEASAAWITLQRQWSSSNSSLSIIEPEEKLPCEGGVLNLPVMYASNDLASTKLTIQVMTRGFLEYQTTEDLVFTEAPLGIDAGLFMIPMKPTPPKTVVGSTTISIPLSEVSAPNARILIFYVRPDGELVSDSAEVDISMCTKHKVQMSWTAAKVGPGDDVGLKINAEPLSFCGIGVVDKSVELLDSGSSALTNSQLNGVPRRYSQFQGYPTQATYDGLHCEKMDRLMKRPGDSSSSPIHHRSDYYSNYLDSIESFEKTELFVITDAEVESRPCEKDTYRRDHWRRGKRQTEDECVQQCQGVSEDDVAGGTTRVFFPESWIWDIYSTDETGQVVESLTAPDTITEWVARAVCVNAKTGAGVAGPTPLITFTPFFIDLTLPPSMKRGEILPVKISVFNYQDLDLPITVELEPSPEYEILEDLPEGEEEVAPGETVAEELAARRRRQAGASPSGVRSACIKAQDKVVVTVRIRPIVIGEVNMTLTAVTNPAAAATCGPPDTINRRDKIIKPIKVEADGFLREKSWSKFVCAKELANNEDSLEAWQIDLPTGIIEGSDRGLVSASGDLLGPTLDNLGHLIRMPYGCGEQNMLNFAPNIFILSYLQKIDDLTPVKHHQLLNFIRSGYQRQLRYKHRDGAYSAFGKSDKDGSIWLTAFVHKTFVQASALIGIEQQEITDTRKYLLRLQDASSGCFRLEGMVHSKHMKGGLGNKESRSLAPITAYVMAALLEAGQPQNSNVIKKSIECLKADNSSDPYTLALKAYAYSKGLDKETAVATLQQLMGLANRDANSIYWDFGGLDSAIEVELAAYAVLTMIELDPVKYERDMTKIIKWISSKNNGRGGFYSTQDTVMALQALSAFASLYATKDPLAMDVLFSGSGIGNTFRVEKKNRLVHNLAEFTQLPTDVNINIDGTGCSLVQAFLRYNVPDPSPSDAFTLKVEVTKNHGFYPINFEYKGKKDFVYSMRINICASYKLVDEASNMAIIEVNLISGYVPKKEDLKNIVKRHDYIKRYEIDGSKLSFYLDRITKEQLCFSFNVNREVYVENPKPGAVTLIDYYQPGFEVNQRFMMPGH